MAWFHKTLGDMRTAIEKEEWQKVKDICDEHFEPHLKEEMHKRLNRASTHLSTYFQKLSNINNIISRINQKEARTPVGVQITILKVMAKEAQESIYFFEKTIQRLIKEGKFEE